MSEIELIGIEEGLLILFGPYQQQNPSFLEIVLKKEKSKLHYFVAFVVDQVIVYDVNDLRKDILVLFELFFLIFQVIYQLVERFFLQHKVHSIDKILRRDNAFDNLPLLKSPFFLNSTLILVKEVLEKVLSLLDIFWFIQIVISQNMLVFFVFL